MKPLARYTGLTALTIFLMLVGFGVRISRQQTNQSPKTSPTDSSLAHPSIAFASYTEENWKSILTPEQYHILREAGTETPFTSPLLNEKRPGTYVSADCGEPVFRSEQKYDSCTGWPSF